MPIWSSRIADDSMYAAVAQTLEPFPRDTAVTLVWMVVGCVCTIFAFCLFVFRGCRGVPCRTQTESLHLCALPPSGGGFHPDVVLMTRSVKRGISTTSGYGRKGGVFFTVKHFSPCFLMLTITLLSSHAFMFFGGGVLLYCQAIPSFFAWGFLPEGEVLPFFSALAFSDSSADSGKMGASLSLPSRSHAGQKMAWQGRQSRPRKRPQSGLP